MTQGGMGQSHLRMIRSPCAFSYTKLPPSLQKIGDLFSLGNKKGLWTRGGRMGLEALVIIRGAGAKPRRRD